MVSGLNARGFLVQLDSGYEPDQTAGILDPLPYRLGFEPLECLRSRTFRVRDVLGRSAFDLRRRSESNLTSAVSGVSLSAGVITFSPHCRSTASWTGFADAKHTNAIGLSRS